MASDAITTLDQAIVNLIRDELEAEFGDRVYAGVLPQKATLPAIVYVLPTDLPDMTMDGLSGYSEASVQIDIWTDDYPACRTLDQVVKESLAISQPRTFTNGLDEDGIEIQHSIPGVGRYLFDDEEKKHRYSRDYAIGYGPGSGGH